MPNRRNPMFGNQNGLPGLPKTTYVTVGGRRVQPQAPRTQMRAAPAPAPMRTARAPQPMSIARPSPIVLPSGPDPTLSRRIDSLDLRINSTEQSNRTLLDELMRLQQDIKNNVRKNEIGIQEERDSRARLEMTIRQSQSKNHDVDDRIRNLENGIKDNRGAIQQMTMNVTNTERMVSALRDELMQKRGDESSREQDLKHTVNRLMMENEQFEKMVKNLREESSSNGNRIDGMQETILNLQNSIRLQAKLMEENSRKPPPKTPGIDKRALDNERASTDSKMKELNSTIQDMNLRLQRESEGSKNTVEDLRKQLDDLNKKLGTYKSKGDKSQQEYDQKMRSIQAGITDTDKQQMRNEMTRVSKELNKKIRDNDEKVRQDAIEKLTIIEKTVTDDAEQRKIQNEEFMKKIEEEKTEFQNNHVNDADNLKKSIEGHISKEKGKLSALNNRMNDVEKVVREHKLEQERLLQAEITERLKSDKVLEGKIDDLEDDVNLGFQTLQTAPKEKESDSRKKKAPKTPAAPSINVEEIMAMQDEKAAGIRRAVADDVGTLEKRVSALETEVKQNELLLENRIQTAKADDSESANLMADQMQQQIDAMVLKHNKLKKKVDGIDNDVNDVSSSAKNLQTLKNDTEVSLAKLTDDVEKEEKERKKDVADIQESIKDIVGSDRAGGVPSLAQLDMDVDQTKTGLKKCAESIHVVKTMLGDKIRDERKLREKHVSILETDVDKLETQIKEVKERIKVSPSLNDTVTDLDDII